MENGFNAVWEDTKIEIGTSADTSTPPVWTYSELCKGIKGIQVNVNENVVTEQYLCGKGHAHNEVTGMAPQIQVTGDRVEGDDAQDFIAGLQFKLCSDRVTSVKVTTGGKVITCEAVVTDVVTFGGNSAELKPFNCNIRFNGEPSITDAPSQ